MPIVHEASFQEALLKDLGHSDALASTPKPKTSLRSYQGFDFPVIPEGTPTVLVQIPFPVTSPGPPGGQVAIENVEVVAVFAASIFIWVLPVMCINSRFCCKCFKRCISRQLSCYFLVCLLLNVALVSIVLNTAENIDANSLFFAVVGLIGGLCDHLEKVMTQVAIVGSIVVVYVFRKRIVTILGFEHQLVKADFRDILTCFSMNRFRAIEVSLFKVEGLTSGGFGSRTLFVRIICGYNELQHTRPHDRCSTSLVCKERSQMNYDPEDDRQTLSIIVKQQEMVGGAVAQMAPAAGAFLGGAMAALTPGANPALGAGIGVVTGVGAANSLGKEIARVDLSAAQVNRLRSVSQEATSTATTGPSVAWRNENFTKIDLVPQGSCWIRISDVDLI